MGGLFVTLLLVALALIVCVFAATWAHLHYWVRRLTVDLEYAESEVLATPDGSRIELRRVQKVDGHGAAALPPIVLVHGIAANHRNQDLHPDASLARHLAALGRDVWLLTLRSGLAWRTRAEAAHVRFAAMVKYDVPLGISTIRAHTGAASVDFVGFSMGGMLLYAALGRSVPAASVRRAVIVGSPGRVAAPHLLRPLLRRVPRWLVPRSRYKLGARAIAFASEWVHTPIHRVVLNPDNVPAGMTRAALVNMVEDIPAPLTADLLEWAARDGAIRVDGEAVLPGLARVRVPALFVAGNADRIAPPRSVKIAFDAWGAANGDDVVKRFVVLGRDFGYRADYGHADLAMGANAASELFAPIAAFLGPDDQPEERGPVTGAPAVEAVVKREPLN